MKRQAFIPVAVCLLLSAALAGCGEKPQATLQKMLEKKQNSEALALAQKLLKKDPNDPYLNAVSAELLLERCVATDCANKSPEDLTQVRDYLSHTPTTLTLPDKTTTHPYAKIHDVAAQLFQGDNGVHAYLNFIQYGLPQNAPQNLFADILHSQITDLLNHNQKPKAMDLLQKMAHMSSTLPDTQIAKVALAQLTDEKVAFPLNAADTKSLENILQNNHDLMQWFASLIPHALLNVALAQNRQDINTVYSQLMAKPFTNMGLPDLDTPENRRVVGKMVENLARISAFTNNMAAHMANRDTFTNPAAPGVLMTQHIALMLDPTDAKTWAEFFKASLENTKPGAPLDFLYDNIDLTKIPVATLMENNKMLLARIQSSITKNESILPALKEIIYRNDAQEGYFNEQANNLLQQALAKAIETKHYENVMTYYTFRPDVLGNMRDKLATFFKSGVDDAWAQNQFDVMQTRAAFITNALRISYSLDAEIVRLLTDYFDSGDIKSQLNTDDPADLLKTPQEAHLDLGPKFAFFKDYFKNRPDVIEAKLKSLAISQNSTYGTAYTLLRLYDEFNPKGRHDMLTNAIKIGITKDSKISAPDLAKIGSELVEHWQPGITYNFIINEVFNRVKTLDDARAVWKAASADFKTNAEKLRPQMTSLIKGANLFEAGKMGEAAKYFSVLSDKSFTDAAQKYLSAYDTMLKPFVGTYVFTAIDDSSKTALIRIYPQTKLLHMDIALENAIGTLETRENFVVNRGNVFSHTYNATYDPETRSLSIPSAQRVGDTKPQPIATPQPADNSAASSDNSNSAADVSQTEASFGFERAFGDLGTFSLDGDRLMVTIRNSKKTYAFRRVSTQPDFVITPNGRYGITRQLSPHDPNMDHVLPVGSILTLKALDSPITRMVDDGHGNAINQREFPVRGTLLHPIQRQAIDVQGYFDPSSETTELRYSYPINDGRTIMDAVVKCNILENHIICAGHDKNWSRQRYAHVVMGLEAKATSDTAQPSGQGN